MVGIPPPPPQTMGGLERCKKNAEGGTRKILVCKGEAEGSFHILLGGIGGGGGGTGGCWDHFWWGLYSLCLPCNPSDLKGTLMQI